MHKPPLKLIPAAIEFALMKHEGHFRKKSRVPYIVHPMRIFATLALRLGVDDEAALAAAILHDTLEDTRTDFDELAARFGDEVASLVAAMSKDVRLPEPEREARFLQQVVAAPLKAKLIKLVDNYDNLNDRLRDGDPAAARRAAQAKRPHIEAIAASLPPEYQWFCSEVNELMHRCLGG